MREIGTKKLGSHIMNFNVIRPSIPINQGIGSSKIDNFQWHIRELADKKTAYRKVCLYANCVFEQTQKYTIAFGNSRLIASLSSPLSSFTFERSSRIQSHQTLFFIVLRYSLLSFHFVTSENNVLTIKWPSFISTEKNNCFTKKKVWKD